MPRQNRHSMCVRERVLRATGGIDTILLDERYTPYDRQPPRIENLCGSFTEYVPSAGLQGVLSQSSCQRELFHLHGNVVLSQVILSSFPHACSRQVREYSGPYNNTGQRRVSGGPRDRRARGAVQGPAAVERGQHGAHGRPDQQDRQARPSLVRGAARDVAQPAEGAGPSS